MDNWPWIAGAVAAVLGFWVLGAYNRLVGLRNAVADAWRQAEEARRRRSEGGEGLLAALRQPLAAEHGALDALAAAQTESSRAASALTARPLMAANARAWFDAERHLAAAAARVFSLADGLACEGADLEALASARATWDEGEQRLRFARQLFNDAAAVHDEAISQFPTSLLMPAFGFGRAGRL